MLLISISAIEYPKSGYTFDEKPVIFLDWSEATFNLELWDLWGVLVGVVLRIISVLWVWRVGVCGLICFFEACVTDGGVFIILEEALRCCRCGVVMPTVRFELGDRLDWIVLVTNGFVIAIDGCVDGEELLVLGLLILASWVPSGNNTKGDVFCLLEECGETSEEILGIVVDFVGVGVHAFLYASVV